MKAMWTTSMLAGLLALCLSLPAEAEVGPVWSSLELKAIAAAGHRITPEQLRSHAHKAGLIEWLCASVASHLRGNVNQGLRNFPYLTDVADQICKLGAFGRARARPRPPPRKKTFMQRLKARAARTWNLVKTKWKNAWNDVKNNFSCATLLKYIPTPLTLLADVLGGFFDANPNGPGLRQCVLEFQNGLICSIPDLVQDSYKLLKAVFFSEKSRPIREKCRRFINPTRRFAEWVAGRRFREGSVQDLAFRVPEATMAPAFAACSVGTWVVKQTVQVVRCLTSGNLGRILWQELFKLGCNVAGGLIFDIVLTVVSGGSGTIAVIAKKLKNALDVLGMGNPASLAKIGKAAQEAEKLGQKIAASAKDAAKNAAIVGALNTLKSTSACKAAFAP